MVDQADPVKHVPSADELITLQEAAEYCGLSYAYLHRIALKGRLEARKLRVQWFTTRQAVDHYIASWQRRGAEDEEIVIRQHYSTASQEELKEMLPDRARREIRRRAHYLGLQRAKPDRTGIPNRHWTPEEDRILLDYDTCRLANSEMLKALDHRLYAGIRARAKNWG